MSPNEVQHVERALAEAGFDGKVVRLRPLSGGCIHQAQSIEMSNGRRLVAKYGPPEARSLFEEESAALEALASTGTVLTPATFGVASGGAGVVMMLMEYIAPGSASDAEWWRFGEDLASLHNHDAGDRYGFQIDNHLGSTPQPNTWCDDWVEFNRSCRLGHQVSLITSRGIMSNDELRPVRTVIDQLEMWLPTRPRPALLHGDLWSGNALPSDGGRVAVIDPASYVGDGWADLAMMRLFGGFPSSVFDAYRGCVEDFDRVEKRIDVYQLYHLLNHVTIFGRGYVGQVRACAARLLGKGVG